jgi:ABC-type Fe3+-siderophore transport system permease subunit
MKRKNKERRSANITLIIMMIGLIFVALPFIAKPNDMADWGFASIMIGGFVSITTFFVFLMFNGRARVQDRMFSGENLLAHWQYTLEFWQQEIKDDLEDSGIGKIVGFFLGGIFAIIGIVVFAADTDDNAPFLLIMLGIAVFFVIIGFISAASEKKRIATSQPEVLIAREGVFYKNLLYTWNQPAITYLECVTLHPNNPGLLIFMIRQLGGRVAHYHRHSMVIPVPPGQDQVALQIVNYFNMPATKEIYNDLKTEES